MSGFQTTELVRHLCRVGVGSQEALHTVSGHSKLLVGLVCPVNEDYLTLMSSPILDPETTAVTEKQCS